MKVSHKWLNDRFFDGTLPAPEKVASLLTMNSFEIESVDRASDDVGGGAILDVKILPNRSHDCLSHKGIAREIAVLLSKELSYVPEKAKTDSSVSTVGAISLSIADSTKCARATKRLVRDVKIEKSPKWLSDYLISLGQKPINNVVDCANFVMLETGQPVHTFDFDKIADTNDGKKNLTIRNAKGGEEIACLDNKTYTLDENMIVISDDSGALDVAGIKGGLASGIDENTKNVVLSACNFDAISIRKNSKKLGLRTDASVRFENGISPELVGGAMELLSALVEKIAGGKVAADIIDIYPKKENKYKVGVSLSEINKVLGTKMSSAAVSKTLERAKFEYAVIDPKEILSLARAFLGTPYKLGSSIRFDAPRSFDCSSLVAFLCVQAGIAIPRMSVDQYVFGQPVDLPKIQPGDLLFFTSDKPAHYKTLEFMPGIEVKGGIDHVALYLGADKMIHATSKAGKVTEESFEKSEIRKRFVGARRIVSGKEKRFVVTVPSERLDIRIKEDLIEEIQRLSGYENIKTVKPKNTKKLPTVDKNLFYHEKTRRILTSLGFSEIYTYSFTDKGEVELLNPIASNKNFLRKNLGDAMEQSLTQNAVNTDLLGLDKIKTFEIGSIFNLDSEALSLSIGIKNRPNIKAETTRKELEEVVNKLMGELGVPAQTPVTQNVVEINLSRLTESLPEPKKYEPKEKTAKKYQFKKISPYPFIVRDIAVFVPTKVPAKKVLDKILKMSGSMCIGSKLFDVFTKKFSDGSEKTSYAFRLVFQSEERTLTDEEINKVMNGVVEAVKKEKDWQVR